MALQEWFARWKADATIQEPPQPDLGDRVMGWHWSLAPGTYWRMFQAEKRMARLLRGAPSAT